RLAALAASLALGCGGGLAAPPQKGKAAFVQHGCWQCHGLQGPGPIMTHGGKGPGAPSVPFPGVLAVVAGTRQAGPPSRGGGAVERRPRRHLRLPAVDPQAGGRQGHPAAESVTISAVVPAKRAPLCGARAEPGPSIPESEVQSMRLSAPTMPAITRGVYWIPA